MSEFHVVTILDYGAGNVRSLRNAIKKLGYAIKDAETPADILEASIIFFPGQGCFDQAMKSIREKGWVKPLQEYLRADRPFFGICLGMQLLFEGSEESPGEAGLGIIPGVIKKFDCNNGEKAGDKISVPQIGWNGISTVKTCSVLENASDADKVYFVHSFYATPILENLDWILSLTDYGAHRYISIVQKGNVVAAQFHPEKSGPVGLKMMRAFLATHGKVTSTPNPSLSMDKLRSFPATKMAKRIVACLDVRSNDNGDLVVTKGDQYDVREATEADSSSGRGGVRNLGKPVALCKRYYEEGADEVVFLNITSFRQGVIDDLPMLQVLESSSAEVFVPLTVGGGIRGYTDPSTGIEWSALDVTTKYFKSGADKVSIGSDAVFSAESYLSSRVLTGKSSIEQISNHYGAQAVVVSIDPKRVYCDSPGAGGAGIEDKTIVKLGDNDRGPNGEAYCWWQVTVKGGRETRDMDAVQLARISQILGAGEIMLNCIDMDGQGNGYDTKLVSAVQSAVSIPVIASSGAGAVQHFSAVFEQTDINAALAAGIFHRNEVSIKQVKEHMIACDIPTRTC
jgi:glutamine amidotransferase/cyclase